MPSHSPCRKAVLLLLLAALAAPWVSRAEPPREAPRRSPASISAVSASAPLRLLGQLWSHLTSIWKKTGCNIDPSGRCAASPDSCLIAPADTGCNIDPSGCRR